MPYRHAHYYLLLLLPLAVLAFWPSYFANLAGSSPTFHLHGLTGTAWVLLLVAQSWTIHHGRRSLHRTIGLWSFLLFPLFIAGGLMVIQTMARTTAAGTNPFYNVYGASLGTLDAISTLGIGLLFFQALKHRRKVHLHARYMLGTVFFLLAPVIVRIITDYPPLLIGGPPDFWKFTYGIHASNAVALLLLLILYRRAPKHGRPLATVAALIVLQSLCFDTLGRTGAWRALFYGIGAMPTPSLVAIGVAASAALVWFGWSAVPSQRKPAPAG